MRVQYVCRMYEPFYHISFEVYITVFVLDVFVYNTFETKTPDGNYTVKMKNKSTATIK